jgi:hypothetical protein
MLLSPFLLLSEIIIALPGGFVNTFLFVKMHKIFSRSSPAAKTARLPGFDCGRAAAKMSAWIQKKNRIKKED